MGDPIQGGPRAVARPPICADRGHHLRGGWGDRVLYTGFDNFTEATNEALFGIFELSPYHNIVHIGIGALWLLAALALTLPAALAVNFTIGVFYVLAAGLGYFGVLEFLSIDPGGFGAGIFYTEDRGPLGTFTSTS